MNWTEYGRRTVRPALGASVCLLGLRVLYLTQQYFIGETVPRHSIESATFACAVAGAACALPAIPDTQDRSAAEPVPAWTLPLFCADALVLYWPALWLGFLSDDFVLVQKAGTWSLGPIGRDFFRPVPLIAWGILLRVGGSAATLHVCNVLLHGCNSFLTSRIASPMLRRRPYAVAAGIVFLTFPASVEAVSWCAGIFDVFVTTMILTAILVARRYQPHATAGNRLCLFACGVTAMLSKETGVVAGVLVAIDAWVGRRFTGALRRDAVRLTIAGVVLGSLRLLAASPLVRRPITKYGIQRWIFGAFGSLLTPWHIDVIRRHPAIPISAATILFALLLAAVLSRTPNGQTRVVFTMLAWVAVATAPTMPFFVVASDLQGSRYLYLATVGWSVLVVAFVMGAAGRLPTHVKAAYVAPSLIAMMIALSACVLRLQLEPWQRAALVRDQIESAARDDEMIRECSEISLRGLPDNIDGAYLFRNGSREAFARDVRMEVGAPATPSCQFEWTGTTFVHALAPISRSRLR